MAESAEPTKMRRRSGLGDFLRARRRRLDPASLGLAQIRRRTPGLRREEVAERAGIGVDWYVRLEQGRDVSPSPETIDALARALSLDAAEHEHLRVLARGTPPAPFVRESVPDAIRRIVESLEKPAYLSGRRWDVLAWNAAAVRLFTDFGAVPERDRNLLIYVLTDPGVRRLFGDTWAGEARRMVAQSRGARRLAGRPGIRRARRSAAERVRRIRDVVGRPRRPARRLRHEAAFASDARRAQRRLRDVFRKQRRVAQARDLRRRDVTSRLTGVAMMQTLAFVESRVDGALR